jgi:hypothetical protein
LTTQILPRRLKVLTGAGSHCALNGNLGKPHVLRKTPGGSFAHFGISRRNKFLLSKHKQKPGQSRKSIDSHEKHKKTQRNTTEQEEKEATE